MDESGANSSSTSSSTSTVSSQSDANSRSISSSSPLLEPSHGFVSRPRLSGHRGILRSARDRDIEEECWSCLIIPITFWFFASMTLILGFYGSDSMVLGPNTSRLLSANSLFVKEIQVQNRQEPGPMLYGFNSLPELNVKRSWSDHHEFTVQADYHQEWPIWLNRGSSVMLNYSIWSTGFFDTLVVVLQGKDGLHQWISDPVNQELALSWHNVHGTGGFTFVAKEDGDYFFAIGNVNRCDVKVQLDILIHGMLYNTSKANYQCSLHSRFCGVKLLFPCAKFALLTTPDVGQGKQEFWYIKLSYEQRWATYFIALGAILSLVLLILRIASKMDSNPRNSSTRRHRSPIKGTVTGGEYGTTLHHHDFRGEYGLQCETPEGDGQYEDNDLYDSRTCAVCYDAPRSSFFDPCGHCVTCYPCGLRIQLEEIGDSDENGDCGACPICRTTIQHVRKLYTA